MQGYLLFRYTMLCYGMAYIVTLCFVCCDNEVCVMASILMLCYVKVLITVLCYVVYVIMLSRGLHL